MSCVYMNRTVTGRTGKLYCWIIMHLLIVATQNLRWNIKSKALCVKMPGKKYTDGPLSSLYSIFSIVYHWCNTNYTHMLLENNLFRSTYLLKKNLRTFFKIDFNCKDFYALVLTNIRGKARNGKETFRSKTTIKSM